ncbi:MAG: hypothetical protein WC809_02730 [Sinimarinibacterium sp.]|jgi:hypothetical protein
MTCLTTWLYLATLLLLPLLSPPVQAGAGSALVEGTDGNGRRSRTQVEYDGRGALRMGARTQPDQYLLFRSGKTYGITRQSGLPIVVELGSNLSSIAPLAERMGASLPLAGSRIRALGELSDTGRTESVAGLQGRIHELQYTDDQGRAHTDTLVVTTDARAHALSKALYLMGRALARANGVLPQGSERLEGEILGRGLGVLRFGAQFRVAAFDGSEPAASRFTLPAQPMQLPDFGSMMPGAPRGK